MYVNGEHANTKPIYFFSTRQMKPPYQVEPSQVLKEYQDKPQIMHLFFE